ncbi:MAG: dTMP kinase [Candidatus Omnitrophica bacterium]|nr:dTMP kinase [Candidatus Omnitrophota bacterium]
MKRKSFFITIEGPEGSGKSSVIKFIEQLLKEKGLSFKVYREPGSTEVGEKIRKILLDKRNKKLSLHTELLLYLAARTQLIEEKLNKDLGKYDFIICDRFFDSTLAYQGFALGLGKVVDASVKMFSLGLVPNLTLVLDLPPKVGLARVKTKDRIESRALSFHNRLRKGYLQLGKKYPRRIKIIDASTNLAQIYKKVEKILNKAF